MSEEAIELLVNRKRYGGWKSVRVSRSIENLVGSFSLSVSEQWSGQSKPWPIRENDECTVLIDGAPVITGFVHIANPSFNANSHSFTVEGRDRACDLVDCSAQLGAWQFSNINLLDLASKICRPYGVSVRLQTGLVSETVSLPKKYSIDPGDSASTALENLCRVAGLLAVSDGLGGLVLTRGGTERVATTLIEGQNMLEGAGKFDSSGRYRTYEVMGSHKGRDDLSGSDAAGVRGTATDLNVRASRTLIVRPENGVTPATAKKRAEWEATTRAARGESVTTTVRGWAESRFEPVWPLNKLVRVKSPSIRVDGDMLIAGVTLTRDIASGTLTQLDLRDPRAFTPDPTIRIGGAGNNYWREIEKGV